MVHIDISRSAKLLVSLFVDPGSSLIARMHLSAYKIFAQRAFEDRRIISMRIASRAFRRDKSSDNSSLVCIDEGFVLLILEAVVKGKFLGISIVLLLLIKLFNYAGKFLMFRPEVGFQLGKDENPININLKGSESRVVDELLSLLVKILIFTSGGFASEAAIVGGDTILVDD